MPTGGGVGLIGMWSAFQEMQDLGWIGAERPQMIAVQAAGCAPIAKAWDDAKPTAEFWPNAATLAAGLRVPKAYGDYLILDILKKSGGVALAVTDDQIMDAVREWGRVEGVFAAPEGAAALAAYRKLRTRQFLRPGRHGGVVWYHGLRLEVSGCDRGSEEVRASIGPRLAANRRNHWTLLEFSSIVVLVKGHGLQPF